MRKRIALLTNWKFRSAVSFVNSAKHVRVKPLRIAAVALESSIKRMPVLKILH